MSAKRFGWLNELAQRVMVTWETTYLETEAVNDPTLALLRTRPSKLTLYDDGSPELIATDG